MFVEEGLLLGIFIMFEYGGLFDALFCPSTAKLFKMDCAVMLSLLFFLFMSPSAACVIEDSEDEAVVDDVVDAGCCVGAAMEVGVVDHTP